MISYRAYDVASGGYQQKVIGVGTTLYACQESVRVMSDIWEWMNVIRYWDGSRIAQFSSVLAGEDCADVVIDADLSVVLPQIREGLLADILARKVREAEHAGRVMGKGTVVRVVRGKTGVGTVGSVVAVSSKTYGYRNVVTKFAVALDSEMTTFTGWGGRQYPCHKNVVWVYDHNCEVANFVLDMEAIECEAGIEADRKVAEIEVLARRAGCC